MLSYTYAASIVVTSCHIEATRGLTMARTEMPNVDKNAIVFNDPRLYSPAAQQAMIDALQKANLIETPTYPLVITPRDPSARGAVMETVRNVLSQSS